MKKVLGQNGLNFIANKYKELRTALSNKVDKISGKGLSTNDYDSTAKAKVDAIPSNPKYTDTVVSVVDNLTTADSTKALSANQGKALQDNKADKSDISRCKTKGYGSASSWQSTSNTRDLEDWIGDFDKRTRELKSGGGVESHFSLTRSSNVMHNRNTTQLYSFVKLGNVVIFSWDYPIRADQVSGAVNVPNSCRPKDQTIKCVNCEDSNGRKSQLSFCIEVDGKAFFLGILEAYLRDYFISSFTMIYECAQ